MADLRRDLRNIVTEARPLVEQWLDLAEQFAALRDAATAKGLDWGQIKALLKAQVQDERDGGDGKRVNKIIDKAEFASTYADMLGMGRVKLNENNYSAADETGREGIINSASDRAGSEPKTLPEEITQSAQAEASAARVDVGAVTGPVVSTGREGTAQDTEAHDKASGVSLTKSTGAGDAVGSSAPISNSDRPVVTPGTLAERGSRDGAPTATLHPAGRGSRISSNDDLEIPEILRRKPGNARGPATEGPTGEASALRTDSRSAFDHAGEGVSHGA
jgi:hypothetical protein